MKKLFPWFCKAIFAIIILITHQQKALSQCFSHIDVTPTSTGTASATGVSDTDFTTFGTILGNATAGTNRLNFDLGYTLPENLTIALYFSHTGTSNINAGIMCYSSGGSTPVYTGTSSVAPGSTTTGASYNHTLPAGTRTFRVYNTSPATTLRLHIITYPKTPVASAIAQSFCSSATTTIASLLPTPSSIYRWYDVPTGGTALLSTATITASDTFYVSEVNLFGCEGPRTLVPVTIGLPVVNTIDNQNLCNGASTTAVNFSGTASYHSWTNNNTSIGLAANGIGNIPAFTATNIGGTAVTATITVNPINAPMAYVANSVSNNVSVINTATNTLIATVPVGTAPRGVSTSPDGSKVYVINNSSNNVSVINTATNTESATISVGTNPIRASVSPDGNKVYVTNSGSNNVSVINTATNTVTATIAVGTNPMGVSVSPDGSKVYVANNSSNNVSVINTATNTVTATVAVGTGPRDICVKLDGKKVYVANYTSNNISVINTATNTVSPTVTVGTGPTGICVSPDGSKVYVANDPS